MNDSNRKNLFTVALASGIILPAAAFFTFVADLPHVLLLVLTGLLFSMLSLKPVKMNDRSIIYFSVMTLVLTVLFDYMFPMNNARFGFMGAFFHPEISAPAVLYAAVFITFFKTRTYVIGGAAAAALITLMFAGDVYNLNVMNERLPMFNPLFKHFNTAFIIVISVNFIFILLSFRITESKQVSRKLRSYLLRKRLILAFIFILLPLGIAGAWQLYKMNEDRVRRMENYFMRLGVRRMLQQTGQHTVFDREVDLNRTSNENMLKNQNIIVLRVVSKHVPGYLRGFAFVNYKDGRWLESSDTTVRQLKNKTYSGMLAFKTFYLESEKKENFTFEVQPSKDFTSKVLLVPPNVRQFDIIANRIAYNRDGAFEPQDWEKDGGYSVFTPQPSIESAWEEPADPAQIPEYTNLPPAIKEQLDRIIEQITELKRLKHPARDKEVISALLKFFSSRFTYKLTGQNPGKDDPVIHFLTKNRAGHCELFASAMALLLRQHGIPSRYVTGFVCEERHPSGKYYVSRLGNAHAWLEAYDRDHKKWLLLEPTPPSGIPNFKHEMDSWESAGDRFKQFFQQLLSDLRRGYFAKIITDTVSGGYELFAAVLFHPVRGPVFLLLLGAAVMIYLKHRKSRRKKQKDITELDRNVVELSREYSRLVNLFRKKYKLEIQETMTVAEFARIINDLNLPPAESQRITTVLKEYQQLRFRVSPPSDEELRHTKTSLHFK
ncbi:MAG: transglutaminase-like domain-containing protein [Victivallaceae bacterium]